MPKTPPPQQPDSESDSLSEINSTELDQMMKTLHKFHKISKQGKLTSFKQNNQKGNRVFAVMSKFFHLKQKHNLQLQKASKQQRISNRHKRLNSQINKDNVIVKNIPKNNNQPQIQETFQPNLAKIICFICKKDYSEIDDFYGYFCPECSQLNKQKRSQSANLDGKTALVTGARIKIGFEITLKLLRDGATVYATSRFTQDALIRYRQEKDFEIWRDRLFLIECDFLSQPQVLHLIGCVKQKVTKLDILINNAAQTIVRPKEFYTNELQNEQLMIQQDQQTSKEVTIFKSEGVSQHPSVYSNEIKVQPGDIDLEERDQFGQPIDKRSVNSWVQTIENTPIIDCLTTQVINSVVPFQLISQLTPIMKGNTPSWIVNVSSMEGVFQRSFKSFNHPHTNMAKAALNMITRTSAQSLAKDNIFMTSVDTGWVTNENPYTASKKMTQKHLFKCPLDCLDGAMRVLDPIYQGVLHQKYPYGLLLKDYFPSSW